MIVGGYTDWSENMTQLFPIQWLLIIPASLITIFIIISIIFSILKLKFGAKETSIISSTIGATTLSIINICSVCLAPTFVLFGIFLDFPVPIAAFLFGVSAVSISNIIIEKWQKDFPFKEFIITALMITLFLSLMFLIYSIPNIIGEAHVTSENENIHIHADLKIFDNDKEIDIYTEENMEKNNFYHFHDGKDQKNVIHFEGKRGTLADFLETMSTYSLRDCINKQYGKKETLYHFWINGQPSDLDYGQYVINDLDKILFKCGSEPPTQEQINSVGSLSKIQSGKD